MKSISKNPVIRQRAMVRSSFAALCGVFVVFFAAAGCGEQEEPSLEPDICDYISGKASVSEKIIEDVVTTPGGTYYVVRVNGTLFAMYHGEFFKVNTEILTVHLKSEIDDIPEDLIVINFNRSGSFDISVPEGFDVVVFVTSLRQRNIFEHIAYRAFGHFVSDCNS